MSTIYRVLGQTEATGTASSYSTLYTVPAETAAIVSNIVVCNRSASVQYFRLACSTASAAVANKEFLAFDTPVPPNDSIPLVMGVTLDTTVKFLMCSATSSLVSFSAFGAETT